ncbi:MAG: PAS domain S-box protein, partial [Acetobacteraceae bacterium]
GQPQLVALRRLDRLPVYAAVIRSRSAIAGSWWEAAGPQFAIGIPATLALLALALLVRRSQLDLITANGGLEASVADRNATLEEVSQALDLTPCMITDLEGRISHWSEGCVRLYGFDRTTALGRKASDLLSTEFPPGGRDKVLAAVLQTGQWQGELRQKRRDGSWMVTSTQWTLRLDPLTGAPMSLVSTRTDLSVLRRTQRALSRSEARLRRAQEASGVVAFEILEDGRVVAHAALRGMFGLAPDTVMTIERCLARFHPPDLAAARQLCARLATAGGGFSQEFRVQHPDGSERWLLARGEAAADPAGGPYPRMVTGIILDVTERRAASTALAESEERLRLAQGAAGFGIYDYDFPTGRVTWDSRMRALWALPKDAPVTNRLFLSGLHADDRTLRRDAVRRAMDPAGQGTYQVEYRVIGIQDGQERWVATTGQVRFADGQPIRLIGLAMDITARKRTEQRNELLMREVDHRAKNALAVVQAALRLSRAASPAELVRIVEGRVAALARAQTILAQRRWEGAELHALLEGELAPFLTGIRRDAPRVELLGPPVTVAAHAAQPLCMAIHELATNAMKYGALSHAQGLLQVTWRLDAANRMLVLSWRESGGPDLTGLTRGRGFGSRVIEQTVQSQLGGTLKRRWLANGLVCDIEVPLSWNGPGKAMVLDGEAAAT